jgi:hypothetical protein
MILKNLIKITFAVSVLLFFCSCSENNVEPGENRTLLFEKHGLVDSAVVYGCYSYTLFYIVPDTLELGGFRRLYAEFDGSANSNGTHITVSITSATGQYLELYMVQDINGINKMHSFESAVPFNSTVFKVKLYINPPVCGPGEFKYNRVRDLKIYGVK